MGPNDLAEPLLMLESSATIPLESRLEASWDHNQGSRFSHQHHHSSQLRHKQWCELLEVQGTPWVGEFFFSV